MLTALSRQHCTRKNAAFAEQPRWSASDIFGYDWVARASRVQCQSDSDFRRLAKTNFQLLLLIPASAVNDTEGIVDGEMEKFFRAAMDFRSRLRN